MGIFLNELILPIGGIASERVYACSLNSSLVLINLDKPLIFMCACCFVLIIRKRLLRFSLNCIAKWIFLNKRGINKIIRDRQSQTNFFVNQRPVTKSRGKDMDKDGDHDQVKDQDRTKTKTMTVFSLLSLVYPSQELFKFEEQCV